MRFVPVQNWGDVVARLETWFPGIHAMPAFSVEGSGDLGLRYRISMDSSPQEGRMVGVQVYKLLPQHS